VAPRQHAQGGLTLAKLVDLPNIGETLAAELKQAGITSPTKLRKTGSVRAALRLSESGTSICSSKLYALEGAIRGIRWHSIPPEQRSALWGELMSRKLGGT
jgi:DNA transformation protein